MKRNVCVSKGESFQNIYVNIVCVYKKTTKCLINCTYVGMYSMSVWFWEEIPSLPYALLPFLLASRQPQNVVITILLTTAARWPSWKSLEHLYFRRSKGKQRRGEEAPYLWLTNHAKKMGHIFHYECHSTLCLHFGGFGVFCH